MNKLNTRQELFCQNIITGKSIGLGCLSVLAGVLIYILIQLIKEYRDATN